MRIRARTSVPGSPVRRLVVRAFVLLFTMSAPVTAGDWVMIETRELPARCSDPMTCEDSGPLLFRNFLSLPPRTKPEFTRLLNSLSTIRGVPDRVTLPACRRTVMAYSHDLPEDSLPQLLAGHPGVHFDSTRIDGMAEVEGFSAALRNRLAAAGFRFLSEADWNSTPGRPKLSLTFNALRQSGGCIVPFSVTLSIREEVLLIRDQRLKTNATIWSGTVRQNLANTNYTPAHALDELIQKFLADWTKANPKG